MRKIFFSVFTALFCLNVNAAYFGVPQQLDMSTWAISYTGAISCSFQGCGYNWTTNNPSSLWPFTYMIRDTFVHYVQNDVKINYPNIPTVWFHHYEDGNASLESFNSSTTGLVALVLFTGHGNAYKNGNQLLGANDPFFLSNSTTCEHSNTACMSFPATGENLTLGGPRTKWAFLDCCLGLYDQNPNNYQHIFNGVHGIYGFQSDGYCWSIGWYPQLPHYSFSSDRYKYLWANWATGGQDMWTAWSNALTQNYTDANQLDPGYIPGWAFAVVFPFGHAYDNNGNWAYINGAQEVISNTFLNQMPMNSSGTDWYPQGMCMWITSLGNPTYGQ